MNILINAFLMISKIAHLFVNTIMFFFYRLKLGHFGRHSRIINPLSIEGRKNIYIGNNVAVHYKSWLASVPLTGCEKSLLIIGDGCVIGSFNHIFATQKIIIHNNVLTASRVYISDNLHGYSDINIPIIKQPIVQNNTVEIGEGSWLGENVCVLGTHIGKHCVIGANSVVTKDIPDYSVAVGIPAKVIKRFDLESKSWRRIDDKGQFIS